jgi:hypothetical protein
VFGLRHLFDPQVKAARQRALQHLRLKHPDYIVGSARLRAGETGRYIFAVFYNEPDQPTIPERYLLIAVPKDGASVEELECTPQSPYWIRGRK